MCEYRDVTKPNIMTFKSLPIGAKFTIKNRSYTKVAVNFATITAWGEELKQWFPPLKNACSMYSQDTEVSAA